MSSCYKFTYNVFFKLDLVWCCLVRKSIFISTKLCFHLWQFIFWLVCQHVCQATIDESRGCVCFLFYCKASLQKIDVRFWPELMSFSPSKVSILSSFESRLMQLENSIIPVHKQTENLQRLQENVDKTLSCMDHVISYYHVAKDTDRIIREGWDSGILLVSGNWCTKH